MAVRIQFKKYNKARNLLAIKINRKKFNSQQKREDFHLEFGHTLVCFLEIQTGNSNANATSVGISMQLIAKVVQYLEPRVCHFSRNTVKSDIKKIYGVEFGRLRTELLACPSRICLTSDAWTSIATDGYLSLTAHYVNKNWLLQKRILNFSYIPPPHTGVALAEKIYSLACDWGIEKKLFSITLDNASANDVCVEILKTQLRLKNALIFDGTLFHVRCCAHILNLIVQDGLKEIDIAVDKIRESVKYVKGSQGRKEKFKNCVSQTSLDSKRALMQDVPTRWNSTYRMLFSALYYRLAFCHLQLSDSNFQSCPTVEEWERVKKICGFLEVFHNATVDFSGSRYPTSNLYFPHVFVIQLKLHEESSSQDLYMKKIADQMFVKFNKYCCEFNVLFAIAVIFDPRYKFQFVEFSYGKLYGSGSRELMKVRETLFGIFGEYMKDSNTSPASSSHSQGSKEVNALTFQDNISKESSNVFKEFDEFEDFEFAVSAQKSQLEMYLDEPRSKRTSSINVLEFWRSQQFRYPELAKLARDVLAVPVSTVASESTFSLGGRILDQYRSSMSPQVVEALICNRDWLFGENYISLVKLEDVTQDIMALDLNKGEAESSLMEGANSNIG
ncbi:zinc finger BED domain-containing protein RICESLEEPER 2-like [Zingiber officinale]|uniref:zinc finger BED domain-containing protein RICESLEEPER 2-like n=1 Tax=Zingiber officinale TaxID=94328 RepID=UPI001C4D845A|nr:zinc finger BED domain-containing protein RICESLEEPER 2-like [Zingiber officinale]